MHKKVAKASQSVLTYRQETHQKVLSLPCKKGALIIS